MVTEFKNSSGTLGTLYSNLKCPKTPWSYILWGVPQ